MTMRWGLPGVLAMVLGLAGCGHTMGERALSGGALGAAGGAVVGAAAGAPGKGALIGGLAGAVIGAVTTEEGHHGDGHRRDYGDEPGYGRPHGGGCGYYRDRDRDCD